MNKWKLIDYFDVWGNEVDGYEVNNLCEAGSIELGDHFTDNDILSGLIEVGYFKESVTLDMLAIEDCFPFVELYNAKTMEPLCRIELMEG
jgi:hypothetical protein